MTDARPAAPPLGRGLARALRRRCPLCGHGPIFHRWFRMDERCARCQLRFERVEGHWFGPLALNTVVSFGALLVIVMGSFLASWPDAPPAWVVALGIAAAVVVPLAFFPWSRTIWLALDLRVRPLEPGEAPGRSEGSRHAPEPPDPNNN